MNERQVEDISIRLFYQPHTVTLLLVSICYALYIGFSHDPHETLESNIWNGIKVFVSEILLKYSARVLTALSSYTIQQKGCLCLLSGHLIHHVS